MRILKTNEFLKPTFDENVKIGDKIHINKMEGEPQYTGKEGIVNHIDDLGQIHGTWGGCALVPRTDDYYVIENA